MAGRDNPKELISKSMLMPQEEMLEVKKRGQKIKIGIPNDFSKVEYRVPLTPQAVDLLVSYGHEILIETNAGKAASYSDKAYRDVGAQITETSSEIFQCDVIIRLSPFAIEEIEMLRGNQVIFSSMQPHANCRETIQRLMQKKITAIAFEYLENEEGFMPFVHQMSQIAGVTSITIASEYLSKSRQGKGVLFGEVTGVTPAELVIIGTSTAAEYAARAATGLGIFVKIFDTSVYELSRMEEKLGRRIFTSVFYPKVLKKALVSADVVIGAMPFNSALKFKVSEDLVKQMKEGSVIIDLNVSQGGCFETSHVTYHSDPVYTLDGIVHYCVGNMPGAVALTSTMALTNVTTKYGLMIANKGISSALSHFSLRSGLNCYLGQLTNKAVAEAHHMKYEELNGQAG